MNNQNDEIQYNIVREKEAKKQLKQEKLYNLDYEFVKKYILNNERMAKEANIYVHRILANIALTLKSSQFWRDNENYQYQLSLFDNEFLTLDNSVILFKMSSYEICKGANYDQLKKSLDFLESFEKDWYVSINSKGERITSLGGLITAPKINQDTGNFQFYISAFWLKNILNLATVYNSTYYSLVHNISSHKHILFFYWLSIIDENKGTNIFYYNLNKNLDLNYKDSKSLCRDFLKGVKANLDKYSHISFNYNYKGDKIHIEKYRRNGDELASENLKTISKSDIEYLNKKYKISYIVKRHGKFNDTNLAELKSFYQLDKTNFLEAYALFISKCRKDKITAGNLKNIDFLNLFQKSIKESYSKLTKSKYYPDNYFKFTL